MVVTQTRSRVAHEIGRPGIIFRVARKRIRKVENAAWHPGIDVKLYNCAVPGGTATTATGGLTKLSKPPRQRVLS